jgi:hypothetical protein
MDRRRVPVRLARAGRSGRLLDIDVGVIATDEAYDEVAARTRTDSSGVG